MKKTLFLMSLLLGLMVSSFALTACGNDDDDDNTSSNPLVGTWYTIRDDGTKETEVTYNTDYTCTWREYKSDGITVGDVDYGRYKIEVNKLLIWWGDDNEPWTTNFTISGNTMTTTEGGGTKWTKK